MRFATRAAIAVFAGAVTVAAGYGFEAANSETTSTALGPGVVTVTVDIEHSHFSLSELRVHEGTLVRFVIDNHDPIAHEFIVGPPSVHRAHELGKERSHPPVPGEVSVDPVDRGVTFYRFDHAGTMEFACHLPGHLAYGMHGIVVTEPD